MLMGGEIRVHLEGDFSHIMAWNILTINNCVNVREE